MTCSIRIYMQFIFDCSCIETDTGRPAYSEPLSLHKNYIKKNQDTTYLTSAHIFLLYHGDHPSNGLAVE